MASVTTKALLHDFGRGGATSISSTPSLYFWLKVRRGQVNWNLSNYKWRTFGLPLEVNVIHYWTQDNQSVRKNSRTLSVHGAVDVQQKFNSTKEVQKNEKKTTYYDSCPEYVQEYHSQHDIRHEKEKVSVVEMTHTVIQPRTMLEKWMLVKKEGMFGSLWNLHDPFEGYKFCRLNNDEFLEALHPDIFCILLVHMEHYLPGKLKQFLIYHSCKF